MKQGAGESGFARVAVADDGQIPNLVGALDLNATASTERYTASYPLPLLGAVPR
jgi:hypothetical protein